MIPIEDNIITTTTTTTITPNHNHNNTNMNKSKELLFSTPFINTMIIIGIFLTICSICTVIGNLLVVLAIGLVKKLRTPSNFLIVSLAVSDLLVGLLVQPLATLRELYGYWPFGEGMCDMFISFDVLMCTASILNLCAISIDRYLAITRPLRYAAKRTPKRMMIMILIVWLFSALISIPPMFGFKEPFVTGLCEYSSNIIYQIYATCGAFYIPLIVMLILYGRILILARNMAHADAKQQRSLVSSNWVCPKLPPVKKRNSRHQNESKAVKTLGIIMGCFCLCWLPFFIIAVSFILKIIIIIIIGIILY
ncbi:unnamed protein product [Schistosoma margrebowiei]|uniref:Uncharacterized protein n=1 Tax=Schistosoma margrebowiei TaxID=48269 RepID=A0A183MM69_9TREM|nr:unnamed protein product [Schistosoma margrebowiei]